MSVIPSSKKYAIAGLLIHAAGSQVTEDKIEEIFKELKIKYNSKIASLFVHSAESYDSFISSSFGTSTPVASKAVNNAVVEEEESEEEESSSGVSLDF
ncbi:hypothetical protein A0H76_1321 [Hepatospora eriocheir]|uniref:Uncharacterized protein n=1 Tax=Hepatospora eriocheir TaxID=1081669 RepID=A0A1X0QH98_9MICR|nr:hypothetical protein HERIO_1908 [Hepatospora eriocheir]ORD99151.1 hypothetical protein A0H76_1321 [Hepatospora eriocheir]